MSICSSVRRNWIPVVVDVKSECYTHLFSYGVFLSLFGNWLLINLGVRWCQMKYTGSIRLEGYDIRSRSLIPFHVVLKYYMPVQSRKRSGCCFPVQARLYSNRKVQPRYPLAFSLLTDIQRKTYHSIPTQLPIHSEHWKEQVKNSSDEILITLAECTDEKWHWKGPTGLVAWLSNKNSLVSNEWNRSWITN